jgi:hypothetical protein
LPKELADSELKAPKHQYIYDICMYYIIIYIHIYDMCIHGLYIILHNYT